MRVHEIVANTAVNGPGNRICLWLQGCARDCPGCFNQAARSMEGGKEISVDDVMQEIAKGRFDGISLSGGEPFLQAREVSELLRRAKQAGLDTLVFTGFTYEELSGDPVLREALEYVDLLVDGPYVESIESDCALTGSGNQRVLRLEGGRLVEDVTREFCDGSVSSEVTIAPDGSVTITGFDDIVQD